MPTFCFLAYRFRDTGPQIWGPVPTADTAPYRRYSRNPSFPGNVGRCGDFTREPLPSSTASKKRGSGSEIWYLPVSGSVGPFTLHAPLHAHRLEYPAIY